MTSLPPKHCARLKEGVLAATSVCVCGSCNNPIGSCKNPMGSCNNPMGSCNNPMTDPCDERYMYLHESLIFTVNVGKYTVRPMNPMEWLVFEQAYFYHSINY